MSEGEVCLAAPADSVVCLLNYYTHNHLSRHSYNKFINISNKQF
jgi:hypothetical protein